ncbi:RNA-directed DNA polymerase, eukaryota, reverse transcriptase zinc-binding domain protein [Tanacetum coccineum]|uniref:RNA-directed DNA polymerase, eukaryota, reverse transcriptase zinc-binding domain protein n=1 Tax=Tanacetum coccineum TaxID=301880 RepID=A0ABQ5HB37_9ASTR
MKVNKESKPVLVLDDSCLNRKDYSLCVLSKVKDFASLANLKVVLGNEGFSNIKIRYMGGYWFSQMQQVSYDFSIDGRVTWVEIEGIPLKLWSENTFKRVALKWGVLLDMDDKEDESFHSKRICINTNISTNILESFKIIYRGKVVWVRAKEVPGWVPNFMEDDEEENELDEEFEDVDTNAVELKNIIELEGDNEEDAVPKTKFDEPVDGKHDEEDSIGQNKSQSEDPFIIYELLKKKKNVDHKEANSEESFKFPPGFTPQENKNDKGEPSDGLAQKAKKDWVKELCVSNKVNFLTLQETKKESMEMFCIKRCWGNYAFDHAYSASVGNSGGILYVWDPKMFKKWNATVSDYFVMFRGEWISNGKKLLIISVYAPQELAEKKSLWDYLQLVTSNWNGEVILLGDFNKVRNKDERYGSVFNKQGADAFNSFISNSGLVEVPLGGCSFTWCHKSATKMSKLDRFLISDNLMCLCPNISLVSLDRYLSDHRPILMREVMYDYRPVPFRFFHYWFEIEGFDKFVEDAWKEDTINDSNDMSRMLKKLKNLKEKLRTWSKTRKEKENNRKRRLKDELADCDVIINKGGAAAKVINKRNEVISVLQDLEKIQSLEVAQKIDAPDLVKKEFLSHFKKRFEQPHDSRLHIDMNFEKKINEDQLDDLEGDISKRGDKKGENDVVDAVTCFFRQGYFPKGGNSSFVALIPKTPNANMVKDFRPICLIGSLYKIIAKILANRLVTVLGDIVNEVQSAFVADRQILDGPFILNELVHWSKRKKKQSLVYKVDFEKAYDSVRWDYLDDILRNFGFGEKWCMWIQNCLRSSRGSVIVNGSLTEEFLFYKGLKQGDPLSPFLFILVMDTLHMSFQRLVDTGLFKTIVLTPSLHLSHMFYADDAIFMGHWSEANIDILAKVLECFHRASGLRINMSKSKLMGIAVDVDKVEQAAAKIGCTVLNTPFSYLGTNVGGCMSRIQSWKETLEEMKLRLSKWKIKTISIGGRLTLLKSVLGSMPIYHMSIFRTPMKVLQCMESLRSKFFNGVEDGSKKAIWVNWKNMLSPKSKGGLSVSSLFALNRALMFKWVWRFITQNSSLWARVIKALHGEEGKIGKKMNYRYSSIWLDIIHEVERLKVRGIDLISYIHSKLGNGLSTSFWEVPWCGEAALKNFSFRRAPRGGAEQTQFQLLKEKVEGYVLVNKNDRWVWSLEGSGDFSVSSVRKLIDGVTLPEVSSMTRWIKAVPIKVNVHTWKVKLDCLPTRLNISRRGMDIDSILCPMCGKAVESTRHIFFTCEISTQILRKIAHWWDIEYEEVSSYEDWLDWLLKIRLSRNHKHLFEEMDLFAFIQVADPTKVKVREQERAEGEERLLDSTVGRVVPLLPVSPARAESELEASMERLFDEGGSADQGDSAAGGGHDAEIELSMGVRIIAAENVTAERPKRPRNKRQAATDAGGSSHPPKKLRGDYRTSGEAATSGKSPSVLKELLASSMLNVEAGVAAVATLPMVTSSVFATLEHKSGPPTDSITELNLPTLRPTKRFVISSDSSHHFSTNAAEPGIDSFVRSVTPPPVMTEAVITTNVASIPTAPASKTSTKVVTPVHALMFHDSDSTGMVKPDVAGSSHVLGKELSLGSRDVNSETLHEVFVPKWNVSNDTLLDDHDVSREFIDHLAPPVLFAQIREMDYHHLFTEFNVGTTRQACLNAKVRDAEIESLKAQLLLKETEAAKAVHLRAQVYAAEATKKMHASEIDALKQKNVALENEKKSLDGKVVEFQSSVSTKDLELKELNVVVSSFRSQKDGLVHELEATCFGLRNQDGLSAGIDHGKAGRSLEDVAAYNPFAKGDYTSALHRLYKVDFPLLAELKSHKDASTADVMDLLRLEGPLADAPGMSDLQPNIEQLKLPIYHPEDQLILCKLSLLVALDVTLLRVERIRENVAAQRSALIGVWTPFVDSLSVENLVGAASTSDSTTATVATTIALSLTFASVSTVPPITIEDYEIIGTDVQGSGEGEAASFPNIVEFEKEELDTTLERDPPS